MYKLIEYFALFLLIICIAASVVGVAWGEAIKIDAPLITVPDYVDATKSFSIRIIFSEKDVKATHLSLTIDFSNEFNIASVNTLITKETYDYTFLAPSQEGKGRIDCTVYNPSHEILWTASSEVKVLAFHETTPLTVVRDATWYVVSNLWGGLGAFFQGLNAPGLLVY